VRVLILTFHEDRAYVNQARLAGVAGYVLKRSAAENLISAIHAVRTGGFYLDPALGEPTSGSQLPRAGAALSKGAPHQTVTDREGEVMRLVALGFSNKEIASQLSISVKSVETYKARASEKLGLKTRAEIVRYASARGWLADV
jgi:DNA-binding NarL/FixJ family response regulator